MKNLKKIDFGLVRWDKNKWLEVAYSDAGLTRFLKVFKREKDANELYGELNFRKIGHNTVFAAYYELFLNTTGMFMISIN